MKTLVLTLLAAASAVVSARAAIVCVAPTSTVAGSIQVTAPVSFTISTTGTADAIVLSGWVTADGGNNQPALSPNVAFTLNGTAVSPASYLSDNLATTIGAIGPNDGYFYLSTGIAVTAGNTLTLLAGTYTIPATSGFNPQATQTFTGNLFVTDGSGARLSANVSIVPEPSAWAALAAGAFAVGSVTLRRRRAARAV